MFLFGIQWRFCSNSTIHELSSNRNESGLVGYWNFEEGSGNTALDLTSNGNNGIINGVNHYTNVPSQSCQLTNVYGCDSTAY